MYKKDIKSLPQSFLYFEGQMHLYLSFYLIYHATILLKQYLILIHVHMLQNIQLF